MLKNNPVLDISRSTTRWSFWQNLAAIGAVCILLVALPPSPTPAPWVIAFAMGYGVALCAAGLLLAIRDAWFRYDENVLAELVDRHWSFVRCANGQWSVLDHRQMELSIDKDWKEAIRLALIVEYPSVLEL